MGRNGRMALGALKLAGGSVLTFAIPRALIAAGVPLEEWFASLGSLAGAAVSGEAAVWAATCLVGEAYLRGILIASNKPRHGARGDVSGAEQLEMTLRAWAIM